MNGALLWEAAGTYPQVCRQVAWLADGGTVAPPETQRRAQNVLTILHRAHVVTCPKEQVDALPTVSADLEQYAQSLRPPFPFTYLGLEGAALPDDPDERLLGALLLPSAQAKGGDAPDAVWAAIPFTEHLGQSGVPALSTWAIDTGGESFIDLDPGVERSLAEGAGAGVVVPQGRQVDRDGLLAGTRHEVERVVAVLVLLDGTIGVELREKDRRELSRQVIRQARRKDAPIAWVVAINIPKRSTPSTGSRASANYSHRFERAAHFACFTKGPHVRDPAKLSSWCPRHGANACRREFRRATVVGPPDKPLIPKLRRIEPKGVQ